MPNISEVRSLLDIQSRQTINEDLKELNLFGRDRLTWSEIRKLLEMRVFLGLKPGIHSREQFSETSNEELSALFHKHRFNVDEQFKQLQDDYRSQRSTHRISVNLILNAD